MTDIAHAGAGTAVRRRGRVSRIAGLTLIGAGLLLLMGVGAFYGYGFYSSTQLGELNATLDGPITLPDSTILGGALLPGGEVARFLRMGHELDLALAHHLARILGIAA